MICCIPTKGRPKTTTYKLFEKSGIRTYHFVEPQDLPNYNVPNIVNIGKNDRGISFCRNFIVKWARELGHDWIVMCDDDVTDFGVSVNGKCKSKGANIWKEIKEKAESVNVTIAGINYRQYCWSEKKNISFNTRYVEVCILINIKTLGTTWRDGFKADRDMCLKVIKDFNGVLKFNKIYFSCPDIGTNTGGLYEDYKTDKPEKAVDMLVTDWPKYVKKVYRKGRIDAKINLKQLAIDCGKKYV